MQWRIAAAVIAQLPERKEKIPRCSKPPRAQRWRAQERPAVLLPSRANCG